MRRIQEPEAWEPQINGAAFEALDMAIEALGQKQAAGSKDLISRSSLLAKYDEQHEGPPGRARKLIEDEPPAQSEIVYCKDCVKHNKGLGNYEVHPDGSTTWIWKDSACPLVSWRDKAQGHEFDYQFCAYAERREVTT